MKIGYIGLGKMGINMVERLLEKGHDVVAFNRSKEPLEIAREKGAEISFEISDFFEKLESEKAQGRIIWIMVSWQAVDDILNMIIPFLTEKDLIIDGGNSPYFETVRRAKMLNEKNIKFMDIGVSGGPDGAKNGACLMIGGDRNDFDKNINLFNDLAREKAFGYFGKVGSGHFVKMVHNGIEYGMMQAIGEGFEIMKKSDFDLDLLEISRVYNNGSVIESRLIGWLHEAYLKYDVELKNISGEISHSGEGEWTVKTAEELKVPVPVIKESLEFRKKSENNPSYTGKIVSVLRKMFGGHDVQEKNNI
jgi:6-phosphogluconate dehydrogenase